MSLHVTKNKIHVISVLCHYIAIFKVFMKKYIYIIMIYTTNKGILFCVIYFQYTKITLEQFYS